jgi:hypothetical protein
MAELLTRPPARPLLRPIRRPTARPVADDVPALARRETDRTVRKLTDGTLRVTRN